MKKTRQENQCSGCEPVVDFILGKTNTTSAKRLTKGISRVTSLWLLAKMARSVKKSREY
jgi:hypothetical protein